MHVTKHVTMHLAVNINKSIKPMYTHRHIQIDLSLVQDCNTVARLDSVVQMASVIQCSQPPS